MKKFTIVLIILFYNITFSQNNETNSISKKDRIALIQELELMHNIKIDSSKIIVINFFIKPKVKPNGSCIDHYTTDKTYIDFLKRNTNAIQFFVTEKNYSYKKAKTKEDKNNIIKDLIFNNAEDCGNYIIIEPNGLFVKVLNEYRQYEIPQIVINLSN